MTDPAVIGATAALGSAASWALGAVLLKRVADAIPSLGMTLANGVVSLVLMVPVLLLLGVSHVGSSDLTLLGASGLLGIAVGDTLFFAAMKDLDAVPLIVLMAGGVVLTPVLAVLFLGEPATLPRFAGVLLVAAGTAAVVSAQSSADPAGRRLRRARGLAFGIAAVVAMSVSTVVAKRGLAVVSSFEGTCIRMAAGTAGVLLLGLATGRLRAWASPFRDRAVARTFVLSTLVVTFGGFYLSMLAIKHVDVAVANTLGATHSIFALPLAAWFLGERCSLRSVGGTLVAVSGIALLFRI